MEAPLVTLEDIRAAAGRLQGSVFRTPLVPYAPADPGRPLWLKAESLQPTGAFKLRGAFNKIAAVLDQAKRSGIVTHSSGNHARAVAWVARELGLRAVVVMPDAAPVEKVEAVRALGAEVVIVPPERRDTEAERLAGEEGYVLVPPYDDPAIIAGQGTAGLEIMEDLPDLDVVLVPVSGGGLISGVATAVKSLRPEVQVVGVEPELAGDAAESLRSGRLVAWDVGRTYRTMADGLRTTSVGRLPWEHIRRYVDDILLVSEEEIGAASRALVADARLVAEPSGAVTLAAYLNRRDSLPPQGRYVAVVSGGSVSPRLLARLLTGDGTEP